MKFLQDHNDFSNYITSYKFVQEILIIWKWFGFEPIANWTWFQIFSPLWMLLSFIAIVVILNGMITFLKKLQKNG